VNRGALSALLLVGCTDLLGIGTPQPMPDGGPNALCEAGTASCKGSLCDTTTSSDIENCGGCGRACVLVHATVGTSCQAGECVFECAAGWGDCDHDPSNGCELDVTSNPKACGACGSACAQGTCVEGACQPFPIASFDDGTVTSVSADGVGDVFAIGNTADQLGGRVIGVHTPDWSVSLIASTPADALPVRLLAEPTDVLVAQMDAQGDLVLDAFSHDGQSVACLGTVATSGWAYADSLTTAIAASPTAIWSSAPQDTTGKIFRYTRPAACAVATPGYSSSAIWRTSMAYTGTGFGFTSSDGVASFTPDGVKATALTGVVGARSMVAVGTKLYWIAANNRVDMVDVSRCVSQCTATLVVASPNQTFQSIAALGATVAVSFTQGASSGVTLYEPDQTGTYKAAQRSGIGGGAVALDTSYVYFSTGSSVYALARQTSP
jgi:hypothetical protein